MHSPTIFILLIVFLLSSSLRADEAAECVVLLHGLARTSGSMDELERKLEAAGYLVANTGYPSREYPVAELARLAVSEGLASCAETGAAPVHFVTHSLGSILVRHYFADHEHSRLGRVVMLGPPNQGSELVDALAEFPGFTLLNGPSGLQLGTGDAGITDSLGAVNFELGVIAGNHSLNPLYAALIPGPDDGKVSVESTRVDGMREHIVMPVSHTWMMMDNEVIDQVISFLRTGSFLRATAEDVSESRDGY